MAASPKWKVYGPEGEYRASTKFAEDAASLVAFLGDGATIRFDHGVAIWREGREAFPASESFDGVRITVEARMAGVLEKDETAGLDRLGRLARRRNL